MYPYALSMIVFNRMLETTTPSEMCGDSFQAVSEIMNILNREYWRSEYGALIGEEKRLPQYREGKARFLV